MESLGCCNYDSDLASGRAVVDGHWYFPPILFAPNLPSFRDNTFEIYIRLIPGRITWVRAWKAFKQDEAQVIQDGFAYDWQLAGTSVASPGSVLADFASANVLPSFPVGWNTRDRLEPYGYALPWHSEYGNFYWLGGEYETSLTPYENENVAGQWLTNSLMFYDRFFITRCTNSAIDLMAEFTIIRDINRAGGVALADTHTFFEVKSIIGSDEYKPIPGMGIPQIFDVGTALP